MYPFLIRGASTSFLAALALLTACSGNAGPPPETLPINSATLSDAPRCEKTKGLGGASNLYTCESGAGPIFVTTLKDCSIPEKFTFQATTRQLLVGVMDLAVETQEPVKFDSTKALHSVVSGTMDADPFLMSIFTFHEGSCLTDLVLWRGRSPSKPSKEDSMQFGDVTSKLAERLVPKLVFVKDPTRAGS
jgi:hypothetical protein